MYDEKTLLEDLAKLREAQKVYATFTQEQVDAIFKAAATAANEKRIELAKMAVEETRMGFVEDKVIKNHFASEFIYNKFKDLKTCGVVEEDLAAGIVKIAEPIGVVGAVVPTTNPTSTAIFKVLISLKTRNAIFLAPHPRARKSTIAAAKIVMDAAIAAGAPAGLLAYVGDVKEGVNPVALTGMIMENVDIILATGGPGMVKAAYSSGTPALGVGAGNTAALITDSADVKLAVSSIIVSKSFDYGVICASEQAVIVNSKIYDDVRREFELRGAYILKPAELKKVQNIILKDGALNGAIVGQSPQVIAEIAGIKIPEHTRIIIGEVSDSSLAEPFAHEKLSILLAMFKYDKFEDGVAICEELIEHSGLGHTSAIYADELMNKEEVAYFASKMKTARILVNTPSSQGAIGDIYNFALEPSLTLGCGSWGGNSVSENVGPKHLLNYKTVATRRENMGWVRLPEKTYFKFGCLPEALSDLAVDGYKKVFIVTDKFLHQLGYTSSVTDVLDKHGIGYQIFSDVDPDPTIDNVEAGAKVCSSYQPDCILALGGGSAMDAAKIMWVLYEHPEAEFEMLALRFMDIRKRIQKFNKMGDKAYFVAVATTQGTGSEVTPFSVITDRNGTKYPLADYAITPHMAVSDAQLALSMPAGLCAASGYDVFTHGLESFVSVCANEMSEPYSLKAMKLVFDNLEESVRLGDKAKVAKEKMAMASTMAGIAFANAFLGICHSLAHKIGARFHIPHGIANALLLNEVICYNATDKPYRQGVFSQYECPKAIERYAYVARYLGLDGKDDVDAIKNMLKELDKLKASINIPLSIKDFGIDEKEFLAAVDELAELAYDDQCTGANPRQPKISDLKEIYLRSYYGSEYKLEKTYELGK
ncbi:MAG: bifunctional acetaldehyde-CoA/alcohol dehydrogenase [Mycoplasmatales bacterium]